MHLEDELFDVAYTKIGTVEQQHLLKSWVVGEHNVISLGKRYTERMLSGWHSIAASFDKAAKHTDEAHLRKLIEDGFVQHQPHGPIFDYEKLVRNERSDSDSMLVVAIINNAIEETRRIADDYRSNYSLFPAAATQLPVWILNFANMWQFALGLKFDKTFVKTLYLNMAAAMRLSENQVIEKISSYPYLSQKLNGSEILYFAFGSNMNKSQMSSRTRGARLMGWADLQNFEYFIDARGVASVRPRIGKSVKGLLWDIQGQSDWDRLDRYEGISSGIYKKLDIDISYRNSLVSSKIYVSSTAQAGDPRLNYQEGIISAIKSEQSEASAFLRELDSSDWEDIDDEFQILLDDWQAEMEGWLRV